MKKNIKKELAIAIAEHIEKTVPISAGTVQFVLNGMIEVISQKLNAGEKILLQNFGTFETCIINRTNYQNLHTGQKVEKPIKYRKTKFKPSKNLRFSVEIPAIENEKSKEKDIDENQETKKDIAVVANDSVAKIESK